MKNLALILLFPFTLLKLILVLTVTFISLLLCIAEEKFFTGKRNYKFYSTRFWGKSCLFILGFWIQKNKRPMVDRFMLMANHRSYVDIFLMAACSPSTFVAKAELLNWPLIGRALKSIHAIAVQRDEMKSLLDTMQKISESVKKGISITVFPEGTTSKNEGTLPFKNGSFKIASQLHIPVIPCAIFYPIRDYAWVGNDTFLGHFFREMWRPVSKVRLCFGEPVTDNDFQVLKEKTKTSIARMLADCKNSGSL